MVLLRFCEELKMWSLGVFLEFTNLTPAMGLFKKKTINNNSSISDKVIEKIRNRSSHFSWFGNLLSVYYKAIIDSLEIKKNFMYSRVTPKLSYLDLVRWRHRFNFFYVRMYYQDRGAWANKITKLDCRIN